MPNNSSTRKTVESLLLLVIIAVVVLLSWKAPINIPNQATTSWLINMGLLLAFTIIAGDIVTGSLRGVLIDSRNKISLSRLQMLLWTVLILSGFLTAVLVNIHRGQPDPLAIELPEQLWALLGISTTSLVGSPLIKNNKKSEQTNTDALAKNRSVMSDQGVNTDNVNVEGQILVNAKLADARWTDIFKGEEVGDGAYLDLGKIQMFFFTLITWFTYAIALGNELQKSVGSGAQKFSKFPALDTGMVALLGISHAAYLANKAIPHTPQPPNSPQPINNPQPVNNPQPPTPNP
jgi:hypothetical protein